MVPGQGFLHVIEGHESAHSNTPDVLDPVEAVPGTHPTRLHHIRLLRRGQPNLLLTSNLFRLHGDAACIHAAMAILEVVRDVGTRRSVG